MLVLSPASIANPPATFRLPACLIDRNGSTAELRERLDYHLEAERRKTRSRARYANVCQQTRNEPRERFLERSREQWESYEAINRELCPDDPVYSKAFSGVAFSTTNSMWELGYTAAQNGQLRILESYIGGEAAASAVLRVYIARVSGQGTGTTPTAYTPEKFNSRSAAAAATYYGALAATVAWGTAQETLNANPLVVHAFNAFGGTDRWVPQPGEELYVLGNGSALEFVSMRSSSGTSTCSGHVIVEEL